MTTPDGRDAPERARLDKWLWRARIYKTRSIAAAAVAGGKVRVNGVRTLKPGYGLKIGDVLTVSRSGRGGLVLTLLALGDRRGPAAEARTLYEELSGQAAGASEARDAEAPDDAASSAPRRGADRRGERTAPGEA